MVQFQKKQGNLRYMWITHSFSFILIIGIWYFQWILGVIAAVLFVISLYVSWYVEKRRSNEMQKYISTLSHRIKKVGEEALLQIPFGIILYSDDFLIEWSNPYMNQLTEENSLIGSSLRTLSEQLIPNIKKDTEKVWIPIDEQMFQVVINREEKLLYFFDRTEQIETELKYKREQTVIIVIFLDNYEEITRNMEDAIKSELNSKVTSVLNNWAHEYGLYLKRTSQERFLAIGTNEKLQQLEETKFDILDQVRLIESEQEHSNPVTLSIGVGYGDTHLPELGELAQSSLDLALGRGGDQVAIKSHEGKVRFYGGKTSPMEKRTRVRARVISHALQDLVRASDQVIIMGHRSPDMDAIGAAIGVLNIAKASNTNGYIIFNENDANTGIQRMVEVLREDNSIWPYFIDEETAEEIISSQSLIVIVDTHKPSMVAHEELLKYTDYKVVIDHHRRGEDFIDNPTLVYMEPYASSTCELVTELLEYQQKNVNLSKIEATAMLAGIIVDTKSFTLRTGSRTFDAASYLRSKGADTVLVQHFMKEDINQYIRRSELIQRAEILYDTVAISKADDHEVYDQVLIAQAADTLLTLNGIEASFVISRRRDGQVGISARSLGNVNVQIIMEQLNGGGHLTNAATQLEETTIDEAKSLLQNILLRYFEGR